MYVDTIALNFSGSDDLLSWNVNVAEGALGKDGVLFIRIESNTPIISFGQKCGCPSSRLAPLHGDAFPEDSAKHTIRAQRSLERAVDRRAALLVEVFAQGTGNDIAVHSDPEDRRG